MIDLDVVTASNGILRSLYEEVLAERRRNAYQRALAVRGRDLPPLIETEEQLWVPPRGSPLPLAGDESYYVGDVTAPEGILLHHGTPFVKSWELRNVGTVPWRDRFLIRLGPNAASTLVESERAVRIPDTAPGEAVIVAVRCKAPWIESTSVAHFKMAFADGRLCWPDRYGHGVDLLVTATLGPTCRCPSCSAVGPLELRHRDRET